MLTTIIVAVTSFLLIGACLSVLGVVVLAMCFPQKNNPLKSRINSCDGSSLDGEALIDPNGNYDWSHIPDNPHIKESDLFE